MKKINCHHDWLKPFQQMICTAWKVFEFGVFSVPYFYGELSVNLRIQPKYRITITPCNTINSAYLYLALRLLCNRMFIRITVLTLYFIMLKNGRTYFKNLSMFGHFSTLWNKGLTRVTKLVAKSNAWIFRKT